MAGAAAPAADGRNSGASAPAATPPMSVRRVGLVMAFPFVRWDRALLLPARISAYVHLASGFRRDLSECAHEDEVASLGPREEHAHGGVMIAADRDRSRG